MSSLQRYKKAGGFVQLLSLIETFGPQKKEKFLEMIDSEDSLWGRALREKMLTLERIFQWPDQVVIEIFKGLPHKTLAYALEGLKSEQKDRMLAFFSSSERRRLDEIITEGLPRPEDMSANMVKVIELARRMLVQGELRAEKFDETMLIPEDIEAKIENEAHGHVHVVTNDAPSVQAVGASAASGGTSGTITMPGTLDVATLQRTLTAVIKENRALKDEVRILREKLDQIRRIA